MKLPRKKVKRDGNIYYLEFIEYVYRKSKQSAISCSREIFCNIAQEICREFSIRFREEGIMEVCQKMELVDTYKKRTLHD